MSLFDLRIAGRLYGGFGALVLFGAGLAGFAVWQLQGIHGQVGLLQLQSRNNVAAVSIAKDLHAARRAVLRYAFDHDEASFAEAEKRLTSVETLADGLIATSTSDQRRAMYKEVKNDAAELKTHRTALGNAVTLAVEGRARLYTEGDTMAAEVAKFAQACAGTAVAGAAAGLETAVLHLRIANWRFLATKDPKGIDIFKDKAAAVEKQVAALEKDGLDPTQAALLAGVKKSAAGYAAAFAQTSKGLLQADDVYYKGVTPVTTHAIGQIDKATASIGETFAQIAAGTEERITSTVLTQEVVGGAAALLGLLIAFVIARGIVRPLGGLTLGMKELADGNFAVVLPGLGRRDEVGDIAQAVETFKVKAAEKAHAEAEAAAEQDQIAARQRKADMHRLADQFEGAVGQIIETVSSASTELEASATTLTATAEHSQELTTMVASASEEASTNVQSVASATEEMASSINEISRQVQKSARIAGEAVSQAEKTNARIAELAQAASRIGDVVELINTIAGQTNLLALNATIEAARAGEAGRGFAVVASEVKALADQTAKATGEISSQIAGMQSATNDSVGAIREIGATIGQMSEIASTIASAVEEQGAATQEISRNVQQAAQGTREVSSHITDVQRGTQETGSASSQVLSAAQSLSGESNRLKSEVGNFLRTVRAA